MNHIKGRNQVGSKRKSCIIDVDEADLGSNPLISTGVKRGRDTHFAYTS